VTDTDSNGLAIRLIERMVKIFCFLICLSAGAVLVLCILDLGHQDLVVQRFCEQPSVLQRFEELRSKRDALTEKESPLVVQASAFAAYLNGPVVQEKKEVVTTERKNPRNVAQAPKIRAVPSAKFKLEGTSYYPNQPERSIALIRTAGSNEDNPRWVKEGERLGHFVIHRIKRGTVVYKDENEQLHEMSIERKTAAPSLVRQHISSITAAGTDCCCQQGPPEATT
jgi:hypothetical protein